MAACADQIGVQKAGGAVAKPTSIQRYRAAARDRRLSCSPISAAIEVEIAWITNVVAHAIPTERRAQHWIRWMHGESQAAERMTIVVEKATHSTPFSRLLNFGLSNIEFDFTAVAART